MNVQNVDTNGRNKYLDILDAAWQEHLKPCNNNAPTVISLFAGAGGSSLGYSMAGYKELLAVEWNDNAVETFKLNFPEIPVWHGDIAKLSVDECLQITGLKSSELDVLDGSPPCQGFSTAGKRQIDDPRNSLAIEFVRLLQGLQSKVFVMENVSGLVKGKMKLVFAEIMKELKASGYQVKCQLMNTMYFNVPQSRQRLIWIGIRNDLNIEPSFPIPKAKIFNVIDALVNCNIPNWQMDVANRTKNYAISKELVILKEGQRNWNLERIKRNRPSPTICKRGGNHVRCLSHWNELRVMTPAELARLGAFPDDFRFVRPNKNDDRDYEYIWERIGNSVPPLFMKAIAEHIRNEILAKVDMTSGEPELMNS